MRIFGVFSGYFFWYFRGYFGDKFWESRISGGGGDFSVFFVEILGRAISKLCSLIAHDCGYPLSRYTCRATRVAADFLDFIAF